jgi:GGDEF domain-containing protein
MAVDFLRAQCRRDQPLRRPVQRPSERQAAAERIQYLSSYDTLTGLPNRALFADRLTRHCSPPAASSGARR